MLSDLMRSTLRIAHSDMHAFQLRFRYVRSCIGRFLARYLSFEFFLDEGNGVGVRVFQENSFSELITSTNLTGLLEGLATAMDLVGRMGSLHFSASPAGEVRIAHWADEYLEGGLRTEIFSWKMLIPKDLLCFEIDQAESPRDVLVRLLMEEPDNQTFHGGSYVPKFAVRKFSKKFNPSQLVPTLGKLTDPSERLGVYSFVLRVALDVVEVLDGEADIESTYAIAFARILADTCPLVDSMVMLRSRFRNRVVLHDYGAHLRQVLTLVDSPLLDHLHAVDASRLVDKNVLIESIFACTLGDEDLRRFWDQLLLSPPELLIKVCAFVLVEVRDLILACETARDAQDVFLTVRELIGDFNSIVQLASNDLGLE